MSSIDPDNPVPRFFWLLNEANEASKAVDDFDLDDSRLEEFDVLVKEQQKWSLALIEHINAHSAYLQQEIKEL